jgi:hypothetical protein
VYPDSNSPVRKMMLERLRALSQTLKKTIAEEILPRLKEEKISAKTRADLTDKLEDLNKSLSEIANLEYRLERL